MTFGPASRAPHAGPAVEGTGSLVRRASPVVEDTDGIRISIQAARTATQELSRRANLVLAYGGLWRRSPDIIAA